eukprot:IDg13576t1
MGRWRQLVAILSGTGAASLYASHTDFPVLGQIRALSAISDFLHDMSLPPVTRRPVLGVYSAMLGIADDERGDLSKYENLRALRTRATPNLASGAPPDALVAPCAGIVLAAGRAGAFGVVGDSEARSVLAAGERDPLCTRAVRVADGASEAAEAALRFVVIVPSARDAHSFIVPADFSMRRARSVDGSLFASRAPRALACAERTVFEGVWEHGLFALVALAGVGRRANAADAKSTPRGPLSRGAPLPAVRMASAVAILFEAPEPSFQFLVSPGDHVQCGQPLALIGDQGSKKYENIEKAEINLVVSAPDQESDCTSHCYTYTGRFAAFSMPAFAVQLTPRRLRRAPVICSTSSSGAPAAAQQRVRRGVLCAAA